MDNKITNKRYSKIVIALLLLFPVAIGSVKIVGNLILFILVFMGIYILFKENKSPFRVQELKLFSWITVSYFLVMLISIIQNEGFLGDLYHLGRKAHFVFAPLIALAIYKANVPPARLLTSIKIGLIVIGCIIFFQDIQSDGRHSGMFNANVFGDIVLVLFFLSIVNFFEESSLNKLLTIISSSMAIYAIIESQNRGTFLVLVILSLVYIVMIYIKYFNGATKNKLLFSFVFIAFIATLLTNSTVEVRFERAINNISDWADGSKIKSSTGLRLEMWSGSIESFKESPWIGHGYRKANASVAKFVDPRVKHNVAGYSHLHNEYITNLISAGIIGLISLLSLLFLPLRVFLQNIKNEETFSYSFMGIMLCLSYAGIGMTHIAFGEEHVNAVYIFFLAIFLPSVIKIRNRLLIR